MRKILFLVLVALLSVACSKSDDNSKSLSVEKQEINLLVGESLNIVASSSEKVLYSSENELIAKVSDSGQVTAQIAGETSVKVSDGKSTINVKVIVSPKNKLFVEPIFDITKDEFIAHYEKLGGKKIEIGSQMGIAFNHGTQRAYIYMFDDFLSLGIPSLNAYDVKEINDWLKERFIPLRQEGNIFMYVSPDKKKLIGVQISLSNIIISFKKV